MERMSVMGAVLGSCPRLQASFWKAHYFLEMTAKGESDRYEIQRQAQGNESCYGQDVCTVNSHYLR